MVFEFDTAANVMAHARGWLMLMVGFVLVFCIGLAFDLRSRGARALMPSVLAGMVGIGVSVLYVWLKFVNVFVATRVTGTQVELIYPAQSSVPVLLASRDIAYVGFGVAGRSQCYIHFDTLAGKTYSSAPIRAEPCAQQHERIVKLLTWAEHRTKR